MLSIEQTIAAQGRAARAKVALARTPSRYWVLAMLAGAYIGVGVVLMVSAAGPLAAVGSGWVKLVSGAVFGVALTLVIFAGGELATSTMMTLPQGVVTRDIKLRQACAVLGQCLVANAVGAVVFSWLVHVSGVLHAGTPAAQMLDTMLETKAAESFTQLLVRGILCNVLVCLAVWMCTRITSDSAKIALIFCAIFAFITSGFEHVVANMTTLTLGLLDGGISAGEAARNLVAVGTGNLIGGCVFVGLAYVVAAGGRSGVRQAVDVVSPAADAVPQARAAAPLGAGHVAE